MIDISKGRYWDLPWSLVDGCTPCSPGCDHCWSAAMTHRWNFHWTNFKNNFPGQKPTGVRFNGKITVRPERLTIPLKRKKPTVYAVWNDLFHEAVPDTFIGRSLSTAIGEYRHTFLVLTKRAERMASLMSRFYAEAGKKELRRAINVWCGLTICNQEEADAKIPIFLQVPGKKFLSIEPMLGTIILEDYYPSLGKPYLRRDYLRQSVSPLTLNVLKDRIDAVILGGETGPGARPMHPDWVRSVRDQCMAAGVSFFFKSGGSSWEPEQRRLLDGRTHDDLPWVTPC